MNRRDFMLSTMMAALVPHMSRAKNGEFNLRAEEIDVSLIPNFQTQTKMFGFNGSMPGPEIRLKKGKSATILVENALEEGTAVHWHGIRLNNAMDGVPMMTQSIIEPSSSMRYEFTPPDAGTFWYHSHYISQEQVAKGLMGPLIIEDDQAIDVDHDITALFSDWLIDASGQLSEKFMDTHSVAHAGYMGNFARAFLSQKSVYKGDRIRLRLINAATNRIFPIGLRGARGALVALDGMSLRDPRPIEDLVLAPAQRIDVIVDVDEEIKIELLMREGAFELGALEVTGVNSLRVQSDISPLPTHDIKPFGKYHRQLTLNLQGGAMGAAHGGDNIWSLNDVSDLSHTPWNTFELGEVVRIKLVNQTAFPHGIHLHGHHFYELNSDGSLGDLRDTTLILANSSRDILCRFDNRGNWLLHCHMLSHSIGGMRTWIRVV